MVEGPEAVEQAAKQLHSARRLVVAGIGNISVEAQRIAVEIADRRGGVVDWTLAPADGAAMVAYQTVGAVSATLGELSERADLCVCWGCEDQALADELASRAPERRVVFVGGGGPDEPCIALRDGADYEAIGVLRGLQLGVSFSPEAVLAATGVSLEIWQQLLSDVMAADFVAFLRGKSLASQGPAVVAALTSLAQHFHASVHAVILDEPAADNRLGAENVLAWQTGYPMAVDFSQGYPRYSPGEYSAWAVLKRAEYDVVLQLSDDGYLSIDGVQGEVGLRFQIAPLKQGGGSYYRSDGLALPLPQTSPLPTAESVLLGLLDRIVALDSQESGDA